MKHGANWGIFLPYGLHHLRERERERGSEVAFFFSRVMKWKDVNRNI